MENLNVLQIIIINLLQDVQNVEEKKLIKQNLLVKNILLKKQNRFIIINMIILK